MDKGLYTAAAGMMLQMTRQDVIANNIANVNTSGYKKDSTVCESFPNMLISRLGDTTTDAEGQVTIKGPVPIGPLCTGASVAEIVTDQSAGSMRETGDSCDLAIGGNGYFAVQTPQGERYTRDGSFSINSQGILVDSSNNAVLDVNGRPINTGGRAFQVDQYGVLSIGGNALARLRIADFANPGVLRKEGGWMNSGGSAYIQNNDPRVQQGYLETSNVNPVQEMVSLISGMRAYESCQKMVQAEDDTLQTAIDQVGSVTG